MKKSIIILFLFFSLFLAGCELNIEEPCVHEFVCETISPTCTNKGYTKYTCHCGYSYIDNDVKELEHNYEKWELLEEPNDTNNMYVIKKVCSECDNETVENIAPTPMECFSYTLIDEATKTVKIVGFINKTNVKDIFIPTTDSEFGFKIIEISDVAFRESGIKTIIIPSKITKIGTSAFANSKNLERVIINSNMTNISQAAFAGCNNLKYVTLPNTLKTIDNGCFSGCSSLKNIVLPDSVEKIDHNAFSSCVNLESINLPSNLKFIGGASFASCEQLTEMIIPDSVTEIIEGAFYKCLNLKTVKLSKNMQYIDYGLFDGCKDLTSITIPNNVKEIRDYAFRGCLNLKTVYNFSNIKISKGDTANGYVGYYANNIQNYQ